MSPCLRWRDPPPSHDPDVEGDAEDSPLRARSKFTPVHFCNVCLIFASVGVLTFLLCGALVLFVGVDRGCQTHASVPASDVVSGDGVGAVAPPTATSVSTSTTATDVAAVSTHALASDFPTVLDVKAGVDGAAASLLNDGEVNGSRLRYELGVPISTRCEILWNYVSEFMRTVEDAKAKYQELRIAVGTLKTPECIPKMSNTCEFLFHVVRWNCGNGVNMSCDHTNFCDGRINATERKVPNPAVNVIGRAHGCPDPNSQCSYDLLRSLGYGFPLSSGDYEDDYDDSTEEAKYLEAMAAGG